MASESQIKILDCTLRDGGYYNNWDFSLPLAKRYLDAVTQAGVHTVEVGFRFLQSDQFLGPFAFCSDAFITSILPETHPQIAVMINAKEFNDYDAGPKAAINKVFSQKKDSPVDLVRIATHISSAESSLVLAKELSRLGYKIAFNLMQANTATSSTLEEVAKKIQRSGTVDILYLADSLGNLTCEDLHIIT
ncbi:MAG: hypothetical protein QGI45_01310, partial [Myxococcota bacterium]|nr:hypothetical protein [Myxococcota bacterium]